LVVVNFSAEWCGTSRMIEDELLKLLDFVLITGNLVVVNFSAEWCGTSRMIADELTKLLD
jgi:thiol-disulfide isomerase/thioredoxin